MTILRSITFLLLVLCTTTVFNVAAFSVTEQKAERKLQESLPQSNDAMWKIFSQCKVTLNEENYTYSIKLTPEVKAMEGKPMTISGFILPLESKEEFTHYLLSKRTPTCAFCPPGNANEIVEVFSKEPVTWDENMVTVKGTMKLTNNPDMGLFFQLKQAETITSVVNEK